MSFDEDDSTFTQTWSDAFDAYKKSTGRDIKLDTALQRLNTTDDLLQKIESQQTDFDTFRSKHSKVWTSLSSAMKPIELLAGLAQGALTLTPFAPASTVLGAALFLIGVSQSLSWLDRELIHYQSARKVSAAYDAITDLLDKVQGFTGRLQEYTKGSIDSKLKKTIVEILTTLLAIFARSEKLIKRERLRECTIKFIQT